MEICIYEYLHLKKSEKPKPGVVIIPVIPATEKVEVGEP
jgi:hypothetical protein